MGGPKPVDVSGQRFGRLVADRREHGKWVCLCDCGSTKAVTYGALRAGLVRSCGCLYRETRRRCSATHGAYRRPEYSVWCNIKSRCNNPNFTDYANYGGRGISVDPAWESSFEKFLSDMGPRPGAGYQIDRINNDGNYEPGNCRWVTCAVNTRNKRTNHIISFEGRTQCITDWAKEYGISHVCLRGRLRDGLPIDVALKTPSMQGKRKQYKAMKEKYK